MRKIFIIFILAVVVFGVNAQFVEGKNYEVVSEKSTEKPTVTEFFSFYCGHCFQFESMVDEYKKGLKSGTTFEKSHVDYIPRNNPKVQFGIVKAFLVIRELGLNATLRPAFFDYIHVQAKPLETEAKIKELFTSNGVSESDFNKHYNDPKLIKEAKKMAQAYKDKKVDMVPTIVVNGKYKLNMNSVKSTKELIKLTNFLLDKK